MNEYELDLWSSNEISHKFLWLQLYNWGNFKTQMKIQAG